MVAFVPTTLYQNTCDESLHYATSHCDKQDAPHLVLQNIAFVDGAGSVTKDRLGGGAIFVNGGTFKAVNIRVQNSTQATLGSDYAGGAIYTIELTEPAYIVSSTFDGNSGSSGGALGSIGTSWTILNSVFSNNKTLGMGQSSGNGGSGGAIYNDGNSYTLSICGTAFTNNTAKELGSGSIFEVVDDQKGFLTIDQSTFIGNSTTGDVQGSSKPAHPSMYVEASDKTGNAGITITSTTFK